MNQNPLTNFEYMDYLIDETPSYVPYDEVFVGWVKPDTAYPARDALWMAGVFHGIPQNLDVPKLACVPVQS